MQVESPLFTVATITYNSSKWVRQSIESVLASSYENFEYIISDDCSSDDTWEIIQQYKDPRIRAWQNEKNLGEYPNRNKVLQAARGKYIIYIDGDDILYKLTLGNLAAYVAYFPEAGMVWGVEDVYFPNVVFPYLFTPEEVIRFMYTIKCTIGYTGLAETLFKVEALRKHGGFSTKYAIGDIYIKKKLSLTQSVLFVPRGFAFWRHSKEQASKKVEQNYRKLIEDLSIDREIVFDPQLPVCNPKKEVIVRNIKIREVKLIFYHTLYKLKLLEFLRLVIRLNIPFHRFLLLLSKQQIKNYLEEFDSNGIRYNEFNFCKNS